MLAITSAGDYRALGTSCAKINYNFPKNMAAKKTAKKTTETAAPETVETPKPAAKKAAKKAAPAAKKTVTKKAVAASAPASTPAAKKAVAKPSLDAVARAAYLNYRRRVEQGLPGDSHGDWLEAERQFADPG